MLIRRTFLTKALHHHLRHYSQSAAAVAVPENLLDISTTTTQPLLTYLPGFPRPDPKYSETIFAVPRDNSGTIISGKLRKVGLVPSIVFEQEDGQHGGNKKLIAVQNKQIKKLVTLMGQSFFLSRLFDLEVQPDLESDEEAIEKVRVLPRMIHLHSSTDAVLNVTFIRAPSSALLKVDVPLVFRGEDVSPGLKKGAYLNIMKRRVKYMSPPDVIPPYIDVDLSELDIGGKLTMGDLKVHPALKLVQSDQQPVCKIMSVRVSDQKKAEQKKSDQNPFGRTCVWHWYHWMIIKTTFLVFLYQCMEKSFLRIPISLLAHVHNFTLVKQRLFNI